jgi:diguanylate cyclase (GGDEF)-like protein/PAS domain S-box-containing protein
VRLAGCLNENASFVLKPSLAAPINTVMAYVQDYQNAARPVVGGLAFNTVLRSVVELQHEIASLGLDRQAVMERVATRTRELTGATAAHVSGLVAGELVTYAQSGADDVRIPDRIPTEDTLCGVAVRTGRSVLCVDTERDEQANTDYARSVGFRSLLAVPVLQAEETIGLLGVVGRYPSTFVERDVTNLEMLSVVLSAALAHLAHMEAQREQEAALGRLRALFDGASVGIAQIDDVGHALEVNEVAVQMLGYTAEELRKLTFHELIHPDDLDEQLARHAELMAGERTDYELEKRYVRKTGEELWAQTRTSVIRGAEGEPLTAIAMIQDVSERRLAEIAIREQSERLVQVVETQRDVAASGGDLETVARLIVERSISLTRAEGATVLLIDGEELVVAAVAGIEGQAVGSRWPISKSIASHAITARDTVLVEHAETDPRLNPELAAANRVRSDVCVPLFDGDRPVAALNMISSSEDERLGEDDRRTVELLAVAVSAAISRAAELAAKREQVEALARFEATFAGAQAGMALYDMDGWTLDANPAMQDLIGLERAELVGRHGLSIAHPEDQWLVRRALDQMTEEGDSLHVEHRVLRSDGQTRWVDTTISFVRDATGQRSFAVSMFQDVTQRKEAEAALLEQAELNEHQALHDGLTGLANRTLFRDRIDLAVNSAKRTGAQVAVMMMDLDRFKEINDSLGHAAGDELLVELATRLREALRGSDTVARLGGDEFGVLLPDAAVPGDVLTVVDRIRTAIARPVIVQGLPLVLEGSIGISLFPDDGDDVEALLRCADLAMYRAKEENSTFAFYDASCGQQDPARLTLVGELRRAIENRELRLYYQPKAVLADGDVRSVEALLRWEHPERGLVMPDEFIPLAQHTGLVKPLTLHVIAEALRQCRTWRDEHGLRLAIAVNLSPRNLLDVQFPNEVQTLLDNSGVEPSLLEFEITESTMLADPVRTKQILERLSEMGIRLSIDDFGTGYSSLAYLRGLPVNEIKIDRSFVMNMDSSPDDATIVRSTIDLGRNLGLDVVAEGVETEAIWDRLGALGCTVAQGYFLSRPVPPEELRAWVTERRRMLGRPNPTA